MTIQEAKSLLNFSGTDDYLVRLSLSGLVLDKRMLLVINRIGNERLESFSTEDFLIINLLFHRQKIPGNLHNRLNRLVDIGIIEQAGEGKYVLARAIYVATGKSGIHTRLVGLDRGQNKELIFKHIIQNGNNGTPLKELNQVLPGHSRKQIQVLLQELITENKIKLEGKTKGAKWFAF